MERLRAGNLLEARGRILCGCLVLGHRLLCNRCQRYAALALLAFGGGRGGLRLLPSILNRVLPEGTAHPLLVILCHIGRRLHEASLPDTLELWPLLGWCGFRSREGRRLRLRWRGASAGDDAVSSSAISGNGPMDVSERGTFAIRNLSVSDETASKFA